MAEIKIFKFVPENAEAISKLIQSVNLLAEPFFITDGYFGIMFKQKTEVGIDKTGMVNEVSKEIMKAQKQFVNQTCQIRCWEAMIENFKVLDGQYKKEIEEAKANLEAHKANKNAFIAETTEKRHAEISSRLGELKAKFQNANKKEKANILKETGEEVSALEKELAPLNDEMKTGAEKYDAETKRLEGVMSEAKIKEVNNAGEVKEKTGFLETSKKDRDQALIFINAGTKLVKDINEGTLDPETNLLTFKE